MSGRQADQDVLARVAGQPYLALPQDLYIPPDALEVFLEAFEGPLDLLLYLIRRQNLDVLDIPVAEITRQYMAYLELMRELSLELAAEYLVMAALLAEIKSRLLLPRPATQLAEEADPRAELVRRLLEYERVKAAAQALDALPRLERDHFIVQAASAPPPRPPAQVELTELIMAMQEVLARSALYTRHRIQREPLSVRVRMTLLLELLSDGERHRFSDLLRPQEGRLGVVVSFLALLEMTHQSLVELTQESAYAPITVQLRGESAVRDGQP